MDVHALRALTPGTGRRIHLNNAGAALLAQPTLDAMTEHLRLEAEIGGYDKVKKRLREGAKIERMDQAANTPATPDAAKPADAKK